MQGIYFDTSSVPSLSTFPLRFRVFIAMNSRWLKTSLIIFVVLLIISVVVNLFGGCLTSKASDVDCSEFPLWAVPAVITVCTFIVGTLRSFKILIMPDKELQDLSRSASSTGKTINL